jgi:hypothetical protein
MKTHSNNLLVDKVFWPSNVRVPVGSKKYGSFVDRLVDGCLKRSRKTLTISEKEQYTNASKWFVYGLLQSYFSLPSVPMAMPMSPIDYSKSAIYQMPFGFKILRKITEVAIELGICSIELGLFNPYGKGKISRVKPTGALLDEFHDTGIEWEYLIPPPKNQGVCMRLKKGDKEILYVERNSSREVARMQDAIFKINKFLSRQCIFIDLPNAALRSTRSRENDMVGSAMQYEFEYEDKGSSLNMQQVFLRRIFCRGSFDLDRKSVV